MNTIQRETQIARENQLLTTQLDRLSALCNEVEQKFNSVINADGNGCCGNDVPDEVLVPLADSIRGSRKRVEMCCETLESIIRRCEL